MVGHPVYTCSRLIISNLKANIHIERLFIVYAALVYLVKGHGAGVPVKKSMRTDIFGDLIPDFSSSIFFLLLVPVHFYHTAIWVALVWSKRGCVLKIKCLLFSDFAGF